MRRLLPIAFVMQFVALDVALRGVVALATDPMLLATTVASISFWTLAASIGSTGWARVVVALVASANLLVQAAFYRYYHAAVDVQVVTALLRNWDDVRAVLVHGIVPWMAVGSVLAPAQYALLRSIRERLRWGRPVWAGLLVALIAAASLGPGRAAARELSMSPRTTGPVVRAATIPSSRKVLPSILFLLTESVRAADYCSAHGDPCAVAPEVDALVPGRFPLREMRSVSSYTAVSVSAILSGRAPTGSRDSVARTPLLFDFMKSLRHPSSSLRTAYWSAQTDSLFERSDLERVLDSYVTVRDLVGHAVGDEDEIIGEGVDRLLAARVATEIAQLAPPLAAIVHFQGTHAPYFVDAADAPFRPFAHVVTWSGLTELHNAYLDAIHEQDKSVARTIRAFLDRVGSAPYVIVFTSDHGEAFGERGAIHHGQNLYEEQIHVPAWIAAGNGALGEEELSALRAYEHRLVTHLDILPTLLDVEGVLHDGMPRELEGAPGRSLVRPPAALARPVPLTNCTEMFRCPLNTWGMLDEERSITAQPWDADWRCVDLAGSPMAAADPHCGALRASSVKHFRMKPNGALNEAR